MVILLRDQPDVAHQDALGEDEDRVQVHFGNLWIEEREVGDLRDEVRQRVQVARGTATGPRQQGIRAGLPDHSLRLRPVHRRHP